MTLRRIRKFYVPQGLVIGTKFIRRPSAGFARASWPRLAAWVLGNVATPDCRGGVIMAKAGRKRDVVREALLTGQR